MLRSQKRCKADDCKTIHGEDEGCSDSGDDGLDDRWILTALKNIEASPYVVGDLKIISLGNLSRLLFASIL